MQIWNSMKSLSRNNYIENKFSEVIFKESMYYKYYIKEHTYVYNLIWKSSHFGCNISSSNVDLQQFEFLMDSNEVILSSNIIKGRNIH